MGPDDWDEIGGHVSDAMDLAEVALNFVDPGTKELRLAVEYFEEIAYELGMDL